MYTPRGQGARISCDYTYRSHRIAVLEHETLAITLLLDQGGSIVEFRHKPTDIDVMYRSPWGMRTWGSWVPTTAHPRGSWIDHYPGGWQPVFPSGSGPSNYKGAEEGTHGEVCLMGWTHEVIADGPDEVGLRMSVETQRLPFRLVRELRLRQGSDALEIRETATNLSQQPMHAMWGQHPALGEPFLGPELELHLPPCRIARAPGSVSGGSPCRVMPGTSGHWPTLPGHGSCSSTEHKDGEAELLGQSPCLGTGMSTAATESGTDVPAGPNGPATTAATESGAAAPSVDLRRFPPRGRPASDMLYASELAEGWVAATNRPLGVGFGLSWPTEQWPYLWIWQELGGHTAAPWFGRAYALGLEPFSSLPDAETPGLAGAVANGTALLFEPQESRTVTFYASLFATEEGKRLSRLTPDGRAEWTG
ncbi:hypothetical protein [Paenibacillus koleovorans]|uniref:hypothetical protein n=1 Tax=Paenibacillus koleovorans TaxID=121608 RepID=UPI000FDCD723|nr:hypothetical protein [Paenibacillus koleovorans]